MRPETRARREAETSAAIRAHAAKLVAAMPPVTPEDVAVLRPVFADVPRMAAPATAEPRRARQGRAS